MGGNVRSDHTRRLRLSRLGRCVIVYAVAHPVAPPSGRDRLLPNILRNPPMIIRPHAAVTVVLSGLLSLAIILPADAAAFPGFRGPKRDNISAETGLLKQWP